MSAETNVSGARLEGADLRNVTPPELSQDPEVSMRGLPLAGSHIDRTTRFDREGLRGADASRATFHAMVFDGFDIRKSNFRNALLEGAIFRNVRAGENTRFDNAVMRRSTFECAPPTQAEIAVKDDDLPDSVPVRRFKNSHFDYAKLQESRFGPCLMSRSIFEGASLQRTTFSGTILTRAEFTDASLDNARFLEGTDLDSATFKGARLVGADLSGTRNLGAAQLEGACGDAGTRLPPDLNHVSLDACRQN